MSVLHLYLSISGEKYGVETEVCQVDFSVGRSIYDKIEAASRNKEIGILGRW